MRQAILCLAFFLSLLPVELLAQYEISKINFDLAKPGKVNAVIRKDQGEFKINDLTSATFREHYVATIFNKKADFLAEIVEYYDGLSSIKIEEAKVYNALGVEIYKLKKSDIVDQSSISGFSVYEDSRIKYLDLTQKRYPYTIEYIVEKTYEHTFHLPNWSVYVDEDIAVESSEFTITAPSEIEPRVYQTNIEEEVYSRSVSDGIVKLHWSFKDLPALDEMYYGEERMEKLPTITTSPSKFEFDGYQGDFSTWDDFAGWIEKLNSDRNDIGEELKDKLNSLVADAPNDREKIRRVYNYLQENTRYVSIQLGIGGYQPFKASVVDEMGYGDCKALSYFTKAMLSTVGIDSKYTLVSSGRNPRPIIKDFPQSNFNHAILCVPNKGDTVWLECTSQTNPFGYLGSFTGNRDVLLIDNGKGRIVKTPKYDESDNVERNEIYIDLDESGNANATVKTALSGLVYEKNGLNFIIHRGEADKKQWMLSNAGFSNFDLVNYSMELDKNDPKIELTSQYLLKKYAQVSGKRVFFELNPKAGKYSPVASPDSLSKNKYFEIASGFTKVDSVSFTFPENYRFEYVPESQSIITEFGEFETIITQDEGKMTFFRRLVFKTGKYKPEDYAEYLTFVKAINKNENPKVVLNKVTEESP